MADMYGAVCSNVFQVKNVEKFKEWFAQYHFGQNIELFMSNKEQHVSFGGYEQYPSAYPRIMDEEENEFIEVNLNAFAKELCEHLEPHQIVNVVAGGNEKLRYVSFDQLIIAQEYPNSPYFSSINSDDNNYVLLTKVLSKKND
jgi:hypothetical protein